MSQLPETFGYRYLPSVNFTPGNCEQYFLEDEFDHIYTCRKDTKIITNFWDTRKVPEVEYVYAAMLNPRPFTDAETPYLFMEGFLPADLEKMIYWRQAIMSYRKRSKRFTEKTAIEIFRRIGVKLSIDGPYQVRGSIEEREKLGEGQWL